MTGDARREAAESVVRWADLEAAAPELARRGRELIERSRFLLVGTIRRDGTPRISAVEARIVEGQLAMAMIPGTLKVRDLLRDPRLTANAPVVHPGDPNAEFKLRGRAVSVADPSLRDAIATSIEDTGGWRPPRDWNFFVVDLDGAAFMGWRGGVMNMLRWTRQDGLTRAERPIAVIDERG
jgi:hypothetical protein